MSDQDKKKKVLSRRDFLKTIGAAGVATTGLTACAGGGKGGTSTVSEIPADRMTYGLIRHRATRCRCWVSA